MRHGVGNIDQRIRGEPDQHPSTRRNCDVASSSGNNEKAECPSVLSDHATTRIPTGERSNTDFARPVSQASPSLTGIPINFAIPEGQRFEKHTALKLPQVILLGHARADVTQVNAQRDLEAAIAVAWTSGLIHADWESIHGARN